MAEDGDRLLTLVGVGLFLLIALAVSVVALGAMNPSPGEETPEVEWSLERVNETHVSIVHGGGDPIPVAELTVTVGGRERRVSWSGTVTEGDAGTFLAEENDVVRLYWTGGSGTRDLLEQWRP
jgi:hypothetical protein